MPDDQELNEAAAGREGLVTQLRALEDFVARSEAEGDALPPEAVEMVARLREIVRALDGLTASVAASAEQSHLPDAGPPNDPS
jgi:hypothetical protein